MGEHRRRMLARGLKGPRVIPIMVTVIGPTKPDVTPGRRLCSVADCGKLQCRGYHIASSGFLCLCWHPHQMRRTACSLGGADTFLPASCSQAKLRLPRLTQGVECKSSLAGATSFSTVKGRRTMATKRIVCYKCQGRGTIVMGGRCQACNGTGTTAAGQCRRCSGRGTIGGSMTCPQCYGTGQITVPADSPFSS